MIFKIYKINALQKKYRESHQMKMNRKPPGPILGHDKQRHAEYKSSEQHKKIFFFFNGKYILFNRCKFKENK